MLGTLKRELQQGETNAWRNPTTQAAAATDPTIASALLGPLHRRTT